MNAPGAEASVVQRMTHHRSVDQLAGYVEPQPAMLLAGPLSIMAAVAPEPVAENVSEAQVNSLNQSSGSDGSSSSSGGAFAPASPGAQTNAGVFARTRSSPSPEPKKARHTVVGKNGNVYNFNYNF